MFDEFKWTNVSEKRNDLTGKYEPLQIELLRSLATQCTNAIFLDIGANVAVYSIMLSTEAKISEIHAFEALDTLADQIRQNLALNNLSERIQVHQVVLSDEPGEAEFVVRSDFAGDGGVRETHQFMDLPYNRIDKIKKMPLDEIINVRERDIILKVDVEGHELQVLQGAKKLLEQNKGFLQAEILRPDLVSETVALLNSVGWFRLFRIDRDYYFSNMNGLDNANDGLELLEDGLSTFVDRTRTGLGSPARKRIAPGIVLEMRTSIYQRLKRLLGRGT